MRERPSQSRRNPADPRRSPRKPGRGRTASPRHVVAGKDRATGSDAAPPRARSRSLVDEIRSVARSGRGPAAARAFERAVDLLQRGRPTQAATAAAEAKEFAPRSGAIREALGLALYQSERYRDALRELQAYRRITGRADQNHLIADCYRALGSPEKAIEPIRDALRARVPEEVRAEAAVVGASALADMGRFTEALGMLRSFHTKERQSRPFDLRVWYTTGDILDRAGRRGEAAVEFRKVVRHDAGAFDAAERLASLT
jgi:tetratricopeptide (TPR) repeat protein